MAVKIIKQWKSAYHDLAMLDNLNSTFDFAALDSNNLLYHWNSASEPKLVLIGNHRVGTVYLSRHPDSVYLWAYNDDSAKLDSISIIDNQIYSFSLPANFILNNIAYYCSPRLTRTVCLLQGTLGGYSKLFYGELGSHGQLVKDWQDWGNYYIGKPVITEAANTLWIFATYGYYNDWQSLYYSWSWTSELDWGSWHSLGYLGSDYHINSLTANTVRDNGGGYALAATNNEGVHFIVPNGSDDAWPIILKGVITDQFYQSFFTKVDSVGPSNFSDFLYLKNQILCLIRGASKERIFSNFGQLQDNVVTFAVTQTSHDSSSFELQFIYSSQTDTNLAVWNNT